MAEEVAEFENPPTDPEWLVVFTQLLDRRGSWSTVRQEPLWRHEWEYTPFESVEAISGWVRSPGIAGLNAMNWDSLVDDVTRGLEPLHTILKGTIPGDELTRFLDMLRRLQKVDPGDIDWSSIQESVDTLVQTLDDPVVPTEVWGRLHRRFARSPFSESSWRTLSTFDGALRLAGHPITRASELSWILADSAMGIDTDSKHPPAPGTKAGLTVAQRLALCRDRIEQSRLIGDRVVWLIFAHAGCSPFVIDVGRVTFFNGEWFESVMAADEVDRTEIPDEVRSNSSWFKPDRIRPQSFSHNGEGDEEDHQYVLVRVELGDGSVASAESEARDWAEALVSLSRLFESSPHWVLASGHVLVLDGELATWPWFNIKRDHSRSPLTRREAWLDSLSDTAPKVERLLESGDGSGRVVIEAIKALNASRDGSDETRLRVAVEEIESLLHVVGVDAASWMEHIPRWFGHLYAIADFNSHLTRLVLDAMSAANWSGRPHPEWKDVVDWGRGSSPVDLVRLREKIDLVAQWPPPGSPTHGLLWQARRLLLSPESLRKTLLLDVESFRRVIARSVRLRNAVAHGGYVERGGLATCVSQAARSATQLAVEVLEALHQDVEPQDHLVGIRDRYTALVENSRDAPDDVLGANRA